MSFFLFLLVNATLFIRPAEVVPALIGWRIYEALIVACFLAALPEILNYLFGRSLGTQPITLFVFGLLAAVFLSHSSHLEFEKASEKGYEFLKIVIYYVLLVSVVNTPARLRSFLFWTVGFCGAMALVSLLNYHGVMEIKAPPPPVGSEKEGDKKDPKASGFVVEYVFDPAKGELVEIKRLQGTGIFQDPNDMCLAVVIAVPLCLFWLTDRRLGSLRVLWLAPVALFCVLLYYTYSRGGFLGFLVGLLTLFHARYGWRRSLALCGLCLPVALVLFAGRMTNIETGSGTGQSRIQLWSESFQLFRDAPLLGIGMDEVSKHMSHVSHNSFIQCYAELGLFGGTLFVGAFYLALLTLSRAGGGRVPLVSPEMARLRPHLMAVVTGSAVCMMTLSLSYIVPTYMVLGLATVYLVVAVPRAARPVVRVDLPMLQRLALVSIAFLAVAYLYVRLMVRWA